MHKAQLFKLTIAIVLFGIGTTFIYHAFIRDLVILVYADQAPSWFDDLVAAIYPRFVVERHRFELSLFLNKADQIFIRLNFCLAIGLGVVLIRHFFRGVRNTLDALTADGSTTNLG